MEVPNFTGIKTIRDIPTGDNRPEARVNRFANEIAKYVATGVDYHTWQKHRCMVEAITILFNDIGACQDFLNVLGIKIDLYTTDIEELNVYLEQWKKGE